MQRDQIWKSLFGDTAPIKSISSPLRLPPTTVSQENTLSNSYFTTSSLESTSIGPPSLMIKEDWPIETQVQSPTLSPTPPPKMGFIPREKTIVDQIRNDIRRTQLTSEIFQCNNELNISSEQFCSRNVSSTDCIRSHLERTTCPIEDSSTNYHQAPVDQMTPVLSNGRSCLLSSPQAQLAIDHRYSDSNFNNFTQTCFSPPANTILDCSSTDATQFDSLRAEPELKCY